MKKSPYSLTDVVEGKPRKTKVWIIVLVIIGFFFAISVLFGEGGLRWQVYMDVEDGGERRQFYLPAVVDKDECEERVKGLASTLGSPTYLVIDIKCVQTQ